MPKLPRSAQVKQVKRIVKGIVSNHPALRVLKKTFAAFKSGKLKPKKSIKQNIKSHKQRLEDAKRGKF